MNQGKGYEPWFIGLSLALVLTFLGSLVWGAVSLPLNQVFEVFFRPGARIENVERSLRQAYTIVWHIRLPRALAALGAGAALGVSGAIIQGLFRNPLASPDVLGISAGSSLGAVLAILGGLASMHPLGISLSAFLGAVFAGAVVYSISRRPEGTHLLYLILAGLAVSSLLNGLVSGILVISEEYALSQFIFWTMGGLDGASWVRVLPPLPFIGLLLIGSILFAQPLNVLSQGEEQAFSLGVGVEKVKLIFLIVASTLTALAVALAGPIAFVGLMVPHGIRLLTGPNHRTLLPLSALGGGSFLLFADLIARTILAPRELKTGILTALIGGPYFIFLILHHRREGLQ
ncbi:MAG: iron ABC transporter permease [Spirochaetales bacterium]|nr:iron ABC transporter permease [Spirochaetales bacterium]